MNRIHIDGETSIKRAALINMASRYVAALVGLAYSVVLARMLTPEDFGIVAMAQVFVTFFVMFQDMGLGSAIVQRQDLAQRDISLLFGFTSLLALVLGLSMAAAGVPISYAYGEPQLVGICAALSLTVFFSTLNTVPNALLLKNRRFLVVGVRQVTCALLASVFGITSAAAGAGPYAIAAYSVSNALVNFVWNWSTSCVRPLFRGMMTSVRKVFGYSAWLLGFNLINYFSRNTDNLLIGYFFGASDLGSYGKAYQLMQYPQTYLTSIVASVLHPMLAERQDDVDYIYDVYVRLTKALSLVGVLVSAICFFSAEEVVEVLYGDQWASSTVCLRWLSVSIWSQMVCGTSGAMFQVLDRTREQFVRGVLIALVTTSAALAGVAIGSIEGVSMCVGLAYFVPFVLLIPFLIRRSFGRSALVFLRNFLPDFAIAAAVSGLLTIVDLGIRGLGLPAIARFVLKFVISSILYVVLLIAFRQQKWVAMILPQALGRRLLGQAGK